MTAAIDQLRAMIAERRCRESYFDKSLFFDPVWDMLLDLYVSHLEGRRVSISSLCIAAAVPGTTALRWIGQMIGAGLIERVADPADRRRCWVVLTSIAIDAMERYLADRRARAVGIMMAEPVAMLRAAALRFSDDIAERVVAA